jgi:hypothetical protein
VGIALLYGNSTNGFANFFSNKAKQFKLLIFQRLVVRYLKRLNASCPLFQHILPAFSGSLNLIVWSFPAQKDFICGV